MSISLVTSILLVPAQKAFGFGVDSQTTLKETQNLVSDMGSRRGANNQAQAIQNQKLVEEIEVSKTGPTHPAHPVTAPSQTTELKQPISVDKTARVSSTTNTVGGLFVAFLFISYVLVGLQYRKHRVHRAAILLQQIETLERIWKMNPQQR